MRYEGEGSRRRGHSDPATDKLARGLGVFSIILGVAEVFAGGAMARALGLREHENMVRTFGFREIANGVGILAAKDPTAWIWGRVAGDALDIASLAAGLRERRANAGNIGIALAAVGAITAVDLLCALKLSRETRKPLPPLRDYSDRVGFPGAPESMRGVAEGAIPEDMRAPEALRPYATAQ